MYVLSCLLVAHQWMVGVGNHDMFYDAVAVSSRYKMPQSAALGSYGNMWYAFDYGNSHWVMPHTLHYITYIHCIQFIMPLHACMDI